MIYTKINSFNCGEIFRAYYHQRGNNERYPIWWLVVALVFVSFGVYLFAKPLFTDVVLLWIFVVLILLFGILLFVDGFLAKPEGKKKVTTTSTKKSSKKSK